MYRDKKSQKNISWHNIMLALVFFVLGYASYYYLNTQRSPVSQDNFGLFWEAWSTLEEKYPFDEPDNQDKIYGAISGLVASYEDEYSAFLPPVRNEFFSQTIEGEFGGIGAEIGLRNGYMTVIAPLKDSPAEQSGVKSGDVITAVDGQDVAGETLDESITRIRGEIGTEVTLTVARSGEDDLFDIAIVRDIVTIPVIDTEIIDDVFVIHLYNFNDLADVRFKEALDEFIAQPRRKLLIDVRDNPGGYLANAIDIASYFIPQGDIVVREQHGTSDDDESVYRSYGYDVLGEMDYELKVLINYGSASASEILAGALQDYGIAEVVGEASYGKGSVQELVELSDDTSLKITIARWLTPEGTQLSDAGIIPDVILSRGDVVSDEDIQLQEAIRLFK